MTTEKAGPLKCSFCGKPKDEVRRFVSGPSCYICNECVVLCTEIFLEDDNASRDDGSVTLSATESADAALACVFQILHHQSERKEALAAADLPSKTLRRLKSSRARCLEIAEHHQERIYITGELIATLGMRNGWPRPVPA